MEIRFWKMKTTRKMQYSLSRGGKSDHKIKYNKYLALSKKLLRLSQMMANKSTCIIHICDNKIIHSDNYSHNKSE